MLLLKRTITALIAALVLFVVLAFGILVIGGAVAGASAAAKNKATDYASGSNIGREAGEAFGRKYGGDILIAAAGAAVIVSFALSFSGALPWCRRRGGPGRLMVDG